MRVLGLSGGVLHDPAAAVLDGGVARAAAEEERFVHEKHAPGRLPLEAARFALAAAGLEPARLDAVAVAWSPAAYDRWKWRFAVRALALGRPGRAAAAILRAGPRARGFRRRLGAFRRALGVPDGVPTRLVEHHLAHAASAFHFSGFPEAAVFTADAQGELPTTLCAVGRDGRLEVVREWALPDSLGMFYSGITDWLGCPVNDGEHRVMGMAAYGDPTRADLSGLLRLENGTFHLDTSRIAAPWRFVVDGRKRCFGHALVSRLGPPRSGDGLAPPYPDVAAAAQRALERAVGHLLDAHLRDPLARTGALCLAGGVAQNVVLNGRLLERPDVRALYVPPAAHDAGGALGAAAIVAAESGDRIRPLRVAALGPDATDSEIEALLARAGLAAERVAEPAERAADLLAAGEIVAWVQGRLEFGPRALGNRSVLCRPDRRDLADAVNARVKAREPWRPFGPAVLAERAGELLARVPDSPFMTVAVPVSAGGRGPLAGVVHADGTVRPQVVRADEAPLLHRLLTRFEARTGIPALLNTSLNRRGEPIARGPEEALAIFLGSGLTHLLLGRYHLRKSSVLA
ncbi:MAG: hypothetical protein L0216_15340 [Planctomycetales bacterium]|nr:hypothetical protein [Planctomycetales bacterium]